MGDEETVKDRLELERGGRKGRNGEFREGSERKVMFGFLCPNPPLHGDSGLSFFLQFQKGL